MEHTSPRVASSTKPLAAYFGLGAWGVLVALLLIAPLPFGSNPPWAWSAMTMIACLGLIFSTAYVYRTEILHLDSRPLYPALVLTLFPMTWTLAQVQPWLPRSWHSPLWQQMSLKLELPYRGMVSIDSALTLDGLSKLVSYIAVFLIAWQLGADRKRAAKLWKLLLWGITSYAAYGLAIQFTGSNTVLWLKKIKYLDDLTGTFLNRNNFATYIGFGLVLCVVQILDSLRRALEYSRSRKDILRIMIEKIIGDSWPFLAAGTILLSALVLTHSRAGIAASLLGVVCVGLLTAVREQFQRAIVLSLMAAGFILFGILMALSGLNVLERILDISVDTEERDNVYLIIQQALPNHLWRGTGLGTFEPAFTSYRDITLQQTWDKAHDVYLEVIWEMGLPAAIAWFMAIGWLIACCVKGYFIRKRDRIYPLTAIGCSVLAATHSLVDFSLQIPAVALTYAAVLGVGFAQAFSTTRSHS